MSSSSDQWVKYYQHTLDQNGSLPAGMAVSAASGMTSSEGVLDRPCSSSAGTNADHHPLSPRGGTVSKPIRRRSRASKRTPTTLLNANTTNFRALVQKFTGCPNTNFSFGSTKGPVNLSFGRGNDDQSQIYRDSPVMANFGSNHQYYEQQSFQVSQQEQLWQQQQQHQQSYQQQPQQQQESLVSFNSVSSDAIFETVSDDPPRGDNLEIPDGFDMDDFAFHELTGDAFSSEDRYDGYFS